MAATIEKLRTRQDRLNAAQADMLRDMIRAAPGLPEQAVGAIVAAIDRQTASEEKWTFIMLSPTQNAAVVKWLTSNSKRPMKAGLVWAQCFTALRMDTGEIMMTRDELAEAVQITPDDVSQIMTELETCGAIIRRRERVPGMRGPGRARYFMNPRVGTHLTGAARDEAQKAAPKLQAGPKLHVV